MAQAGAYLSLGLVLPSATFVGWVIGYLLDKAFGTHFLSLPFLLLGTVAGFVQFIREVGKLSRDDS